MEKDSFAIQTALVLQSVNYQRIIDAISTVSPDIIYLFDIKQGQYVFINRELESLPGYSPEEISASDGTIAEKSIHPDDMPAVKKHFETLAHTQSDDTFHIEYRIRAKSGEYIWLYIRNRVYQRDAAYQPEILFGIIQDTSERKHTEERSQQSEERYRVLVENINTGIFESSLTGSFLQMNKAVADIAGYSSVEEMMSKPASIMYAHTEERDQFIKKLLSDDVVRNMDLESVCKDGTKIWVSINAILLRDSNGNPEKILGMVQDITTRKKAELALREKNEEIEKQNRELAKTIDELVAVRKKAEENETTYKILYDSIHDALFTSELNDDGTSGKFILVNDIACERLGYTREELLTKTPADINSEKTRATIGTRIQRALKDKYVIIESEHVTKDGRIIPIELSYNIATFKNKKVIHAIARDITERKQAERMLQESEQRLRFAAENLNGVLWVVDTDLRIVLSKGNGLDKMGLKPDEITGMTMYEHFKTTNPSHPFIANYLRALNGETVKYENCYSDSIFSTVLSPIKDIDGKITGVVSLTQDITDRKHAENAIADEKERLAVTLRSIGDGVITTDMQGNIVIMNKVAETLTGWTQSESKGKPLYTIFNIINESTRQPHESPVAKVLLFGKIIELANHTILISRDGTERSIADSAAPIKDRESKTIGVVLVFRDVTEKQKLYETAQNVQKLESLGILAGGIAHDFNNLLGGIFGNIDMANEEPDKSKVSAYLSKAMSTIDRARALTNQLLTFAKGGDPVQKVGYLFPFVQETATFALSGANVSCDFDVPLELWTCNFDKNQIGQVIDNIIINAQQAMPLGGKIVLTARNVTVSEKEHPALTKGNYIKISIKDSGIGIPRILQSKIFDPFFTTKTRGHGLGLATCYSIIHRHGGCIDVESETEKGSTFHIYLPASTDSVSPLVVNVTAKHNGGGIFLVMDDEEVMRETISDMLVSLGYVVLCKDNGKDIVDVFKAESDASHDIAGMIFDLTVPGGMGGKAALEEIRKIDTNVPVFVASGYAEDPVMKNPAEFGFTASICKPFRKSELSEMLNRYLTLKV